MTAFTKVKKGPNPGVSPSCPTGACPPPHIIHMHLDADRDGIVDDDYTGLNLWTWGKGKRGAIIICNNDDDDNNDILDNVDNKINGGNDKDEIAPLEFRVVGSTSPTPGMEAYIEISVQDAKRIRIFDGRAAGAKEIIGPSAGNVYKFPNLNFQKVKYGMEAIEYAGLNFDGKITLTFLVKDSGSERYKENAVVRVAPWMMPNHNDPALKVFVVDAGSFNDRFRNELKTMVVAAGCTLDQSHKDSYDIWMQDCMEIGYSNLPNTTGIHVVARAPRDSSLNIVPKKLLAPDFGYSEVGSLVGSKTYDSTGNLEVTPPGKSKSGKKYPFGRIYFGPGGRLDKMNAKFKAFLNKQVVQKPIEVDTSWLFVGHVDEIMTFVPASSAKGFKMLLASPKLAYKILHDNKALHGSSKLLTGRSTHTHSVEFTITRFLKKNTIIMGDTSERLKKFNSKIQGKLNIIKRQFKNELGIDPATDIIYVPIIFNPNENEPKQADALTAGMVNMLVINKHCIIPKPFGPIVAGKDLFEEYIKGKLTPMGLTVNFLDDWKEYHINSGEVHCGTNTLRATTYAKWWEYKP